MPASIAPSTSATRQCQGLRVTEQVLGMEVSAVDGLR